MIDMPHTPSECPDDTERAVILAELVSVLFQKHELCPACARSLLLEVVAGGDEIFETMRQAYMRLH